MPNLGSRDRNLPAPRSRFFYLKPNWHHPRERSMTIKVVRNHSHWGAFTAEVEGGRVIGVRPFEHDPDPSTLIDAIPDAVHSKSRIMRPMVREGWLRNGPGASGGRGNEPFVPVSWDD